MPAVCNVAELQCIKSIWILRSTSIFPLVSPIGLIHTSKMVDDARLRMSQDVVDLPGLCRFINDDRGSAARKGAEIGRRGCRAAFHENDDAIARSNAGALQGMGHRERSSPQFREVRRVVFVDIENGASLSEIPRRVAKRIRKGAYRHAHSCLQPSGSAACAVQRAMFAKGPIPRA